MKNLLFTASILILFFVEAASQNYYSTAFPDQNGHINLSLLDFCKGEIQWQIRDTSSSDWSDIADATTNPFLYQASPQNIDGKEFQAKVTLFPDTTPKYSYPFGIKLVDALDEIEVNDFYNGSFIYYQSNDTLYGGYFGSLLPK